MTPLHHKIVHADGVARCAYCAKVLTAEDEDEGCDGPLPLRVALVKCIAEAKRLRVALEPQVSTSPSIPEPATGGAVKALERIAKFTPAEHPADILKCRWCRVWRNDLHDPQCPTRIAAAALASISQPEHAPASPAIPDEQKAQRPAAASSQPVPSYSADCPICREKWEAAEMAHQQGYAPASPPIFCTHPKPAPAPETPAGGEKGEVPL